MERSVKSYTQDGKRFAQSFRTIVSEISQELSNFLETGSEVSHFIPEPRNFAEVTRLAENIRKPWLKATHKEIKNRINNKTFMIEEILQEVQKRVCIYLQLCIFPDPLQTVRT